MALSVEKLLSDAHMLITRLKGHDSLADGIIGSTQALLNKVEATKQYQDDITELNEIAKHRPRSTLVLGIAQENLQIRHLQQENRELEASLEEHQSALELIMQKYREHTMKLLQTNQIERALKEKESSEKNSMCHLMDKIDEMAGVMQQAIEVDETSGYVDKEKLRRMEVENRALREMLEISSTSKERIVPQEPEPSKLENESSEKPEGGEGEEEGSDSEADTSTLKRFKDKDEEEDSDDADSSTLKRSDTSSSLKEKAKDEEDSSNNDNDDIDGGASSSSNEKSEKDEKVGGSGASSKDKEEKDNGSGKKDGAKKETSPPTVTDSKKKTDTAKKPDTLGSTIKESSSVNRNVNKSPVSSKSTGDLKKSRVSSSPVKKTSSVSSAANKKEAASSSSSSTTSSSSTSLKKTSSVDLKKDTKSKATAKPGPKK